MDEFFNSQKPYEIAGNITGGHELTNDLVSFVYIIMREYKKPIDDCLKFFTRTAHNQWNWSDSEFNRLYNPPFNELNEGLTPYKTQTEEESEYKRFLRDYLESPSDEITEWYKKEMAKLLIQGMTYREIQSATTINLRYISETIKQFIEDVNNNFNSRRLRNGCPDSPPAEY